MRTVDAVMGAYDPLKFDLVGQSQALLHKIERHTQTIPARAYLESALKESPQLNVSKVLSAISRLMSIPALTVLVADNFLPLLMDLCARWLDDDDVDEVDRLVALCLLVEPYEEIFPILAAYLRRTSLSHGPLRFLIEPDLVMSEVPALHLQRILIAYYRLLGADPSTPARLGWSAALLQVLFRPVLGESSPHPNHAVRWLALRCFGLQTHLSEITRTQLETEFVNVHDAELIELHVGCELDTAPNLKEIIMDARVFPLAEIRRIQTKREQLAQQPIHSFFPSHVTVAQIIESDLSRWIVNVSNVLLFSGSPPNGCGPLTPYVATPTTTGTLRSLALHVSQRLPTLLSATSASGKMTLLRELARRIHPQGEQGLVVLQLADTSLDAKSLIGSYVSASATQGSTGSFEWQDGAIPRALRSGKWLVLADVDRASTEVLATFLPLVENMRPGKFIGELPSLDLGGGRGRIQGAPSFMLFGMRSVGKIINDKAHVYAPPTFFGHKHWFEVQFLPPSVEELVSIVQKRFSGFEDNVSFAIVTFWQQMKDTAQTLTKARDVGMRDLEKFCARLEQLSLPNTSSSTRGSSLSRLFPNHVIREDILLEARDVFFAAYELGTQHFNLLAHRATALLDLDDERASWVLSKRTPQHSMRKAGDVIIGRSQLQKNASASISDLGVSKNFALHRPALTLLESIATSVKTRESILLVGETGTGKTTSVQHAAQLTRTPLVVLNLSNQSEASDLLGGFRPIDARVPAGKLQEMFTELFGETFSRKKNKSFEDAVRSAYVGGKWARVVKMWREAGKMAGVDNARDQAESRVEEASHGEQSEGPRKRRKLNSEWENFMREVDEFDAAHVKGQSKFVFSFVEGPLVTALRNGHWILLDEVNLASSETLECISSILQGPHGSVTLTEAGQLDPVPRHPGFRLFACMNPATDAGKKDLPPNIRSRFTEFYVPPPDADEEALRSMVQQYIGHCSLGDKVAITDVADFYITAKRLTATRQLADGQNHVPHFSMRTLARALTFASDLTPIMKLRRALWEGIAMAFTMTLDTKSAEILRSAAEKHILGGIKNLPALLNQNVPSPDNEAQENYIQLGPFWLLRGPEPVKSVDEYILTPSVQKKLIDLARIVTTRRFPVLIEGPTSSGKTSSVEYLAKQTGHRFVRINNHEHTDLQEYLGSYMTDPATGKLKFQDGVLVRALRAGDWIVLDELNLAPTDVLEALNRLLDDNRELVVPETNEIIRPHPNFMLFATQNPPGLYAGRKVLSRAFRNRFLEVHFDDVPQDELETILCQRCGIAQSHGRKIVAVFQELQKRRQVERVFETKNSFATLRDLFRWANRHSEGYTENATGGNYQHIAEQGYMLLAERARRADDRAVVKAVIEDIMKVKIDEHALYDLTSKGSQERIGIPVPTRSNIIWTGAMSRLFTLVAAALRYNEPVLLIGETGSGKTSVCELLALAMDRSLYSLSCHQNTETADLLGSQRPLRNRQVLRDTAILEATQLLHSIGFITEKTVPSELNHTIRLVESALKSCPVEQATGLREALSALNRSTSLFEWHDGPLIQAMREGGLFLLDEISLADDSVLERLNSVLEPSRQLVLAEKGGDDFSLLTITAKAEFQLVATMNPGGDYGKKELSPALRNRFTEIWVPHVDQRADLFDIIQHSWKDGRLHAYTSKLLDFAEYTGAILKDRSVVGLRDLLAWVSFSNFCTTSTTLSLDVIFHHSARLTILDGIPTLSSVASLPLSEISRLRLGLEEKLHELVPLSSGHVKLEETLDIGVRNNQFWVGSFSVAIGNLEPIKSNLSLHAPTTLMNASRVVRALQIPKPLLLEGSPGVGKTSLILALAAMSGHPLCRINLSDQTDLIDLFGSDMPIEGGNPGEFAWRDAAFLRAMQNGDWVLLDEMNLAPQAVLEGLNAVLDHRGTVFIPELGREFTKHPNFRVFAAQNPLGQGGGRKGLPKSFVNRFTKVFVEALSRDDLQAICGLIDSDLGSGLADMLTFNERLCEQVINNGRFGREGSPWEFNLRDLIRWISLWKSPGLPFTDSPYEYIEDAYLARFRSFDDRQYGRALYDSGDPETFTTRRLISVGLNQVQFGHTLSSRSSGLVLPPSLALLQDQSLNMEVASKCIDSGWLLILNGPTHSGKTSLIRAIASLRGEDLREFCMSPGTDATDLLGGFEHSNRELSLRNLLSHINTFLEMALVLTGSLNSKLTNLSQSLATALEASGPEKSAHSVSLLKEIRHQLVELHGSTSSKVVDRIDNFILQDPSSSGRFEWIDGPLVKAMKEGQWLVLDHCNLCNPAVLDRLNSLCETDGVLVLSERGTIDGEIPVIVPHPNFRLFMLLNSRYGELSRAMRNRGIEVTMAPVKNPTDIARIRQSARLISSFESNQDSLTEDTVLIQLIRRGLALRGSDQVGTKRVPILPNLVLAATDSQAFRLAPVLSVLDAPLGIKKDTKEDIAKLLFMATSVSRDSWYILSHYLSAFGHRNIAQLWINLSGHHILENSDSLGARVGTERGVSSPFLLSQPVLHHLNTNLVTPSLVPGLYHESVMQELGWEAVVQAQTLPLVNPLTNAPSNDLLSIMDKSRLVWGGLGAVVNIPHYVRSIAPFLSALNHACQSSLNTPDVLGETRAIGLARKLCDYSKVLQAIIDAPYADFAAIQTVVQLVGVALSEFSSSSVHFQQAVEITNKLMQDVRLKSGQGMLQIWSIMQQPTPTQSTQDLISRIAIGPGSLFGADGRRERLEIIAMLYIQESSELIECANKILKVETERASTIADDTMMGFDHQETCIAMAVIMSRAFRGTSTAQINAVFFDAACRVPSLDLRALAFLRLLLWEVDLPIMKPSDSLLLPEVSLRLLNRHNPHMLFAIQLQWMRACWSASESQTPTLGPQSMLMSVEYPACLARWWILASFSSQLTEGEQHQISRIQENLHRTIDERSACLAMTELALFLCKCSCSLLAQMAQKHLSDLNNSLDLVAFDSISATKFIGEAWIRCAYMLLELYFPDVAMDPLGGQATHRHLWEIRTEWLELYEQALELGRQLGLGTNYDSGLRRLYDSTCEARKQYDQLKPTTVRGPEHLRHLTEMFAEAHTFLAQAIERPRIFQLIESLKSSSANSQTQEELVQQTVANFLQRLRQNYPTLSDVVAPLEYALQQLKLGLRLYASSIAQTESNRSDVSAITQSLLQRPSIRSAHAILKLDVATVSPVVPLAVSSSEWIIAQISALLLSKCVQEMPRLALRPLTKLYNSFLDLWLSQKAREARAEEDARSLYKPNKLDSAGESEEIEMEREFNELFPSFGDILDDTTPSATHTAREIVRSIMSVTTKDIEDIYQLHNSWAMLQSDSQQASLHIYSTYSRLADRHLARIVQNYRGSLDTSVDAAGFSRQMEMLRSSRNHLESSMSADFNFYQDYSALEMNKAARLLDDFCARLATLIVEWPDQMVLQHLQERCQAIQQLRLNTPLAKVLSALEQLLLHTADWETYANKDNSLKGQQQQLTDLIIDWRQIELKSWSTLLDRELLSSANSVSSWWPRLYESIVGVIASFEGDQIKVSNHLQQLVPLLDSYLAQSPLGQFECRLTLLRSFAELTKQLSEDSISLESFSKVSDVVKSLCVQYLALLPLVRESLKKQRATLDKDIKDFIKLASWKDTNVHALKQSAQKTHHVLYKCIRKFREIIRQPVSDLVSSAEPNDLSASGNNTVGSHFPELEVLPITQLATEPSSSLQNINLLLALEKYQGYAGGLGKQLVFNKATELIHDLTTRIISGAKELADVPVPESGTRARHIKALVSRKRRAWSELLKELKRLGLSGAITTDTFIQHEDRAFLLSLYVNPDHGHFFSEAISKSNLQFSRLLQTLPEMRAALPCHHPDVSTRDFQRACNLVESSFSHVIEARKILKTSLVAYSRICERLERIVGIRALINGGDPVASVGEQSLGSVHSIQATVAEIHASLAELVKDISRFHSVADTSDVPVTIREVLENATTESAEILTSITSLKKRGTLLEIPIWTRGEAKVFDNARVFISDIKATFGRISNDPSIPVRLFQPICDWLKSLEVPVPLDYPEPRPDETLPSVDEIISKLLTGMQTIVTSQNLTMALLNEEEIPDKAIRIAVEHTRKITSVLGIPDIEQAFGLFVRRIACMNGDQIAYSIDRLAPFLQVYTNLARNGLAETLSWLGSISRLTITLASTVRNIMQKGFCRPPDIEDEGDNSKGGQELTEGTGMGEGSGAENISNQIEDESQVEGLKGENDSGEKGSKNGEDGENKDAIEMSEDFTGEMEDVSSDDEDEDEDDGSKSGSEGDPEERIQELDSANSNTVDEKLWNDETASEKPEGQDQAGEDNTAQSNEQSQTAAKEDKPQQSKESSRVNESEQPTEDDKVEEEAEAEGMEEQTEQVSDGRKMDDFVPEANTLDLPDDIDLGPSDDKEANDTEDGIGDEDTIMGDGESVDESADNHDESHEPDPTSQATTDDATEADPNFEADQTIPGDNKEKGDEERDHNPGRQDIEGGDNQDTDASGLDNQVSSGADRGRSNDGAVSDQNEYDPGGEHTPETKTDTAVENDSTDPTAGGSDTQTRPQGTSQRQEKPPKQELPNPLRSLGDASKEIQRRVDEILNRQNAPSIQPEPVQDAAEVEYMQNEDDDQEMQALGPSNEVDETAKLRDLRIDEDTQGVPQDDRTVDADIEMDPVAPSNVKQEPAEPRNHSLEAALTAEELSHPMHGPMDNLATNSETSTKREVELEENVPLDSAMVERTIAEWQASGKTVKDAEEIWRLYENLTQDSSHALCEQLRLILAPTRATRLRGDFRTGKRLNMKKLVPYVASDFTRDKIWLRRTRPAAREYQVLLAVDDSRSMAREPHTIHLTRQALALVARALEKLEVGELALARFGREMEVVHEFGAGVLQGGAALNKFTFNQPATDVLRLVESSLDVLRSAREGSNTSSSADLWQLEIVISDGICQDHERLRTVLRRAEEERVMVVFVVVDTPASNGSQESSIVSMLQPTIKMVNGKMDIQMERYLDSFPFRYFVVLRDVDALPSVLAGTLRQFFERISED
ncbi:ATPase, partial [Rhizoctonia solani]